MAYFTPDFLEFYRELAGNNHRDWFHENKKRYEKSVKEPFAKFINDLREEVQAIEGGETYGSVIFRVNRDIRFSQDKSPYKLFSSAVVKPGVERGWEIPGMYLELGPEQCGIYGGAYSLEKEILLKVREAIAKDTARFTALLAEPSFVNLFGTLKGEANVRMPKEFQEVQKIQPLIANKQFYVHATQPDDIVCSDTLMELVLNHYKAMRPVNQWLRKAMEG